jgi:hypothetical protein
LRRLARSLVVVAVVGAACLPTGTRRLAPLDHGDDDAAPPVIVDGGDEPGDAPTVRPHAILGVDPPHGPFAGGTLTAVRGNGFDKDARVWFGDSEVPAEGVLVLDRQRLQVTSPPGKAGAVDVVVQNGDDTSTRATSKGGYTYDDFYLDPATGPTAGGSLVTVTAQAPLFDETTEVEIDLEPCEIQELKSATELTCRTPAGTPGQKSVRVTTGDETVDVLEAFTYVVSNDGYQGGLSGEPLDGQIQVLVLDNVEGLAIPGATVLAGNSADSVLEAKSDSFGTALIASSKLGSKATITVAKKCFQPQTFVDVPVQKLTVYLDPVLSPACGDDGELPAGGGVPGKAASISGQLVWPYDGEVRMNGFGNVPAPILEDVKQVAYVFRLSSRPTDKFSLPSAVSAVTPETTGDVGYDFYLATPPGNFTLYALAGLEDRTTTPYVFTPYAMGLTRGVAVGPSQTRSDVFIQIDLPLDHALRLDATGPKPTPRGPDRLEARLAIEVGSEGYMLLPNGLKSSLLPGEGTFNFVGIPPLTGSLTGTRYVATALAATGAAEGTPRSAVGLYATTTDTAPIGVDAFVEVPTLSAPASSARWNRTSFDISQEKGGPSPDLTLIDVSSGNDLVTWRIVAPGAPEHVEVPDLSAIDPDLTLVPGVLAINVKLVTIDDFSYSTLATAKLTRGYRAYAEDVFFASY